MVVNEPLRRQTTTSSSTMAMRMGSCPLDTAESSFGQQDPPFHVKHVNTTTNQNAGTQQDPSSLRCFFHALTRKKPLDERTDTNLNRCLNLVDLTTLGVGSTLGLGLYVLAGQVASNKAGPGVVISFALAALASAFSALCYAEFAGRVPKAGSAYAYSYITVGEFVAFIIGWNLILEYVIGASSVARGFSGYLRFVYDHVAHSLSSSQQSDSAVTSIENNSSSSILGSHLDRHSFNISAKLVGPSASALVAAAANNTAQTVAKLSLGDAIVDYVIKYFDWPSVAIIVLLTIFILFGVKESTNVTLAFTAVNMIVVVTVVLSSLTSLDLHNWRLTKEEVPQGYGTGGFLPYGWSGVLAGSATCFFGFIGFDTIASSAEEAKNPKRNVPLSIILSLFISFVAYMAIAIVQTLLWPYYDQNNITILPYIFGRLDMQITYWTVLLGAIAGLASSQLGGMYPLPRILYSMAQDKLIYSYLARVNRRLKLPVRATIIGSTFVAILSCLLDIQDLADMVSIGTLAAYSLVSLSVLIVRYEDRRDAVNDSTILSSQLNFNDILSATGTDNSPEPNSKCSIKAIPFDCDLTRQKEIPPSTTTKTKLGPKPSTPIREKGSRPLVAKLSVGFNSWFKSETFTEAANDNLNTVGTVSVSNNETLPTRSTTNKTKNNIIRPNLLDLLIKWKSDDDSNRDSDGAIEQPDDETSRQSKVLISLIVILTILFDFVAICLTSVEQTDHQNSDHIVLKALEKQAALSPRLVLISIGCIILVALLAVVLMLSRLPVSKSTHTNMFQVPLVPLTPTLSILVNTFLMLNLSYLTWVRFIVWMTVGLFIYFTYGIWNSEGYLLHVNN